MKSKLQIIEETVQVYSNPANRAVKLRSGACYYHSLKNDKRCAVGRCFQPDVKIRHTYTDTPECEYEQCYFAELVDEIANLEELLKPEYRGHELAFWMDLQKFHDDASNFTDCGLSIRGELFIQTLKEKYEEDQKQNI
jgi:hypothetical protein